MSIKTRLAAIKKAMPKGDKIFLVLAQDMDNPELYHKTKTGHFWIRGPEDIEKTYTRADIKRLEEEENYTVLIISWVRNWNGANPNPKVIEFDWADTGGE